MGKGWRNRRASRWFGIKPGPQNPSSGLVWLLLDNFNTDESNPLASPRTCEPGPGAYTVTDGESVFSIVNGELDIEKFAATKALRGTTSMRSDGYGIFSKVELEATCATIRLGWSTSNIVTQGWSANAANGMKPMQSVSLVGAQLDGLGPHYLGTIFSGDNYYQVYKDGGSWKLAWVSTGESVSSVR
jgi:hypothetical protein